MTTTTAEPISVSVLASATDLYTAFVSGSATRAQLITLLLCNTTSADITVDVWKEVSGPTLFYMYKTITVPALGQVLLTAMFVIKTAAEKWRAQASATGVDATGAVVESGP